MNESFKFTQENRAEEQEKADKLVQQLELYGAEIAGPDPMNAGSFSYKIKFPFPSEEAFVNMWLELKDWQTDSDLVITNMTTVPDDKKSHGFGSRALASVLEWAHKNNLREVRATQVSNDRSGSFWEKSGFKKEEVSQTGDWLLQIPEKEE